MCLYNPLISSDFCFEDELHAQIGICYEPLKGCLRQPNLELLGTVGEAPQAAESGFVLNHRGGAAGARTGICYAPLEGRRRRSHLHFACIIGGAPRAPASRGTFKIRTSCRGHGEKCLCEIRVTSMRGSFSSFEWTFPRPPERRRGTRGGLHYRGPWKTRMSYGAPWLRADMRVTVG